MILTDQRTSIQEENLTEHIHIGSWKGNLYGKHRNESKSSV